MIVAAASNSTSHNKVAFVACKMKDDNELLVDAIANFLRNIDPTKLQQQVKADETQSSDALPKKKKVNQSKRKLLQWYLLGNRKSFKGSF